MLVALSGVITGVAAAGHVGPFAALGAAAEHTVATQLPSTPLRADSLYPAPTQPPAVHETIVITDPARFAPASAASGTPAPTPESTATPEPTASPSPTTTPCHDDDCGGGGDH
jgi:hypothetical protein